MKHDDDIRSKNSVELFKCRTHRHIFTLESLWICLSDFHSFSPLSLGAGPGILSARDSKEVLTESRFVEVCMFECVDTDTHIHMSVH